MFLTSCAENDLFHTARERIRNAPAEGWVDLLPTMNDGLLLSDWRVDTPNRKEALETKIKLSFIKETESGQSDQSSPAYFADLLNISRI